MAQDYYQTLGISRGADEKEIKKAFRKQAKKWHPDANQDNPSAEAKFKEINEAYEVLSDPEKRASYDRFGANWKQYQQGFGGFNGGQTQVNMEDLSDLFSSVFGGGGAGGRRTNAGFRGFGGFGDNVGSNFAMDGEDINQSVQVSLQEAYEGTERVVNKEGRQLKVKIPAGATDGTTVRLSGEGYPGRNGGRDGNLYLVVDVMKDSNFQRDMDDLIVDVKVDAFTAMLGGEIEIPTMTRQVKLKIPAGTQSGQKFRLSGKGMPVLRKKGEYGDLYARIMLTVPKNLTDEQRNLVEELQATLEN